MAVIAWILTGYYEWALHGLRGSATLTLVAPLGCCVVFLAAWRHTMALTALLIILIAFIPVYWLPSTSGSLIPPYPAVIAGFLIAPVALLKWGLPSITAIDSVVLGLTFVTAVTCYANFQRPTQVFMAFLGRVAMLYLAMRIVAANRSRLRIATVVTVWTASLIAATCVYERLAQVNLFQTLVTPHYQAELWAHLFTRFGEVRASGSFGQPIPMGIFFAVSMVVAAGLMPDTKRPGKMALLIAEVALGAGLWSTLTRGPLAVLIIGYLTLVVGSGRASRARQLLVTAAVAVPAIVFTPLGAQIVQLWSNTVSAEDTLTASSTQYRGQLFQALLDSRNWSALGLATGNAFDQSKASDVQGSVDNEYLLRLLGFGGVNLLLFLLIAVLLTLTAFRLRDPLYRAWAASTFGVFIGISTVALLLQQADFFWVGVAFASAGAAEAPQSWLGNPRRCFRQRKERDQHVGANATTGPVSEMAIHKGTQPACGPGGKDAK